VHLRAGAALFTTSMDY